MLAKSEVCFTKDIYSNCQKFRTRFYVELAVCRFLLRNVVKIGQRCGVIKCLIELYSIKVIHAATYSCLPRNALSSIRAAAAAAALLSAQRPWCHSRSVNVTWSDNQNLQTLINDWGVSRADIFKTDDATAGQANTILRSVGVKSVGLALHRQKNPVSWGIARTLVSADNHLLPSHAVHGAPWM